MADCLVLKEHANCFLHHLREKSLLESHTYTKDQLESLHHQLYSLDAQGTFLESFHPQTYSLDPHAIFSSVWSVLRSSGQISLAKDKIVFSCGQSSVPIPVYSEQYVHNLRTRLQTLSKSDSKDVVSANAGRQKVPQPIPAVRRLPVNGAAANGTHAAALPFSDSEVSLFLVLEF